MSDEATQVEPISAAVRGWIEHKRIIYKVPPKPTLEQLLDLAKKIHHDLLDSKAWQDRMNSLTPEEVENLVLKEGPALVAEKSDLTAPTILEPGETERGHLGSDDSAHRSQGGQ